MKKLFLVALIACGAATMAHAEDVIRLPLLDSKFPIAAAVTVHSGIDTVFMSGALGPTVDPAAPKDTKPTWGNMETQAMNALTSIKATLGRMGLGMGDVVKMTIFMVGDPAKDNKMDFAGMMASYTKFFGTKDQPNLPARSAVQVAALAAPGALIEIECVAAKPH